MGYRDTWWQRYHGRGRHTIGRMIGVMIGRSRKHTPYVKREELQVMFVFVRECLKEKTFVMSAVHNCGRRIRA